MVEIRELGPDDWAEWKEIRLRALADSPDAFGRTYEEEAQHPDGFWQERVTGPSVVRLVAERDGAVVGAAAVWLDPGKPSVATLFSMWVDPSARRQGVGRSLLARAVEWAAARGLAHIDLTVTEGNTAAYEMYVRAGFTDTGEREPLRDGSPLQTLTMRRRVGV